MKRCIFIIMIFAVMMFPVTIFAADMPDDMTTQEYDKIAQSVISDVRDDPESYGLISQGEYEKVCNDLKIAQAKKNNMITQEQALKREVILAVIVAIIGAIFSYKLYRKGILEGLNRRNG